MCFMQQNFLNKTYFLTSIALVIYVELQPLTLLKVFKYMCSIVNFRKFSTTLFIEQQWASASGIRVPKISSLKINYILSINSTHLLKICYNITTKGKFLKNNTETIDFLLQQTKEIDRKNGNLPNKKGEFECLLAFTSRAPIFQNATEWLLSSI